MPGGEGTAQGAGSEGQRTGEAAGARCHALGEDRAWRQGARGCKALGAGKRRWRKAPGGKRWC
eukprot:5137314-Pleurochrysis_carterae.AAC.1